MSSASLPPTFTSRGRQSALVAGGLPKTLIATDIWWCTGETTPGTKARDTHKAYFWNVFIRLMDGNGVSTCIGVGSLASVACFVVVQMGKYPTGRPEDGQCHHSQHKGGFLDYNRGFQSTN